MTKDEAKKQFINAVGLADIKTMYDQTKLIECQIDEIFKGFESRTCESCKHCDNNFRYKPCPIDLEDFNDVNKQFGCNKWEQK